MRELATVKHFTSMGTDLTVLLVFLGCLGGVVSMRASRGARSAGEVSTTPASGEADLHVYVYLPGEHRLALMSAGPMSDALDVVTNATSTLIPTAAFMWLSPQLEQHLNHADVAKLWASLRVKHDAVLEEVPSASSPFGYLEFLVKSLKKVVGGNRLAMNVLLDVLSDTLGINPLEKLPEMLQLIGLLDGVGPAHRLTTSTLVTAYSEIEPGTSASGFWSLLNGCPAIQEHQSSAKERAQALGKCLESLGGRTTPTPSLDHTTSTTSTVDGETAAKPQRYKFPLAHYLLAMLSAILPS